MKSAADFPYDPDAIIEELRGVEKLRAIEDRDLAADLFELLEISEQNADDIRGFLTENEKQKERERLRGLRLLAESCLSGKRGEEAKKAAVSILLDGGRKSRYGRAELEALERNIRDLKRRSERRPP